MGLGEQLNRQIGEGYKSIREQMLAAGTLDEEMEDLIALIVSQDGERIVIGATQVGLDTDVLIIHGETLGTSDYRCILTAPQLIQVTFRKEPRKGKARSFGFLASTNQSIVSAARPPADAP